MNKAIGIILILVGGLLLYKGATRKDSLVGSVDETSSKVANKVDGGGRVPEHYFYLIGGGILAAVGVGAVLRSSRV